MSYIHNTTFIVERAKADAFIAWAREVYIPAANMSGIFSSATMVKVLTEIDPATSNYAIQLRSDSLERSEQWHKDVALILKDDIAARLGNDRILFFSTDMEVIE